MLNRASKTNLLDKLTHAINCAFITHKNLAFLELGDTLRPVTQKQKSR